MWVMPVYARCTEPDSNCSDTCHTTGCQASRAVTAKGTAPGESLSYHLRSCRRPSKWQPRCGYCQSRSKNKPSVCSQWLRLNFEHFQLLPYIFRLSPGLNLGLPEPCSGLAPRCFTSVSVCSLSFCNEAVFVPRMTKAVLASSKTCTRLRRLEMVTSGTSKRALRGPKPYSCRQPPSPRPKPTPAAPWARAPSRSSCRGLQGCHGPRMRC